MRRAALLAAVLTGGVAGTVSRRRPAYAAPAGMGTGRVRRRRIIPTSPPQPTPQPILAQPVGYDSSATWPNAKAGRQEAAAMDVHGRMLPPAPAAVTILGLTVSGAGERGASTALTHVHTLFASPTPPHIPRRSYTRSVPSA